MGLNSMPYIVCLAHVE
uniref:Uncharacterized protein n=1 Tax=Arundo donax TaxID=35708 RepID=A0A0A9AJS4_ARUDO